MRYRDIGERLLANSIIDGASDCWYWIGAIDRYGYGTLTKRVPGYDYPVKHYAHRESFEYFRGQKIPHGFELHHRCYHTSCINPDHLQVMRKKRNLQLRRSALHVRNGRTWMHCDDR